ncbi:tyrosine-type recombinase/integrase [Streptomyces sp. DSM 40750]|uniref:tyrosine-type recombinase/integrase n=1 Tax=Streptomyces sp. DSM 40750 TaxID=2801030 RepID=UPI00214C88F4|nr:site-specific integrase [Streptomyces sp. DSM 40750]UUU23313.1 site-specific integrase [Streptomyces sp. DSM 40750]
MTTAARKSPLRTQQRSAGVDPASPSLPAPRVVRAVKGAEDARLAQISELELHLSTTTNRQGRPFQRRTINAYKYAATQLHHWLTAQKTAGDFTAVDTGTLNRFFRWYYQTHDVPKSQDGKGGYTGGTNTVQRNLRALFSYLSEEYDTTDPYRDPKLQKYATPPMGKPKTLSTDFVSDMLKATGNGSPKTKDFQMVRDHAIIRVLTEGLRSDELLNLRVQDLDLAGGTLVVIPIKMDRNSVDGRIIPIQPKTVKALSRWLRARATHKLADRTDWLWLGTRNRSKLLYAGLHRLTKKWAEEAGYDPAAVSPHSFCHTWADDLKAAGVSGEHIMAVRGWKSPAMLRRYGADMASKRAVDAVHALGDRY